MILVWGPASFLISSFEPTAVMRPLREARASAQGSDRFSVHKRPLSNTRSAGG